MIPACVGLDVAVCATGVAYPDGTSCTLRPRYGPENHPRRLYQIARLIDAALRRQPPDVAVIEGYSLAGARGISSARLCEAGGIVRLALVVHQIPMVEIPPKLLKKWACGNGNADKDLMVAAARARLAYQGDSHDEADALFLRHAALVWYGNPEHPDRQLLAVLDWPDLGGAQ